MTRVQGRTGTVWAGGTPLAEMPLDQWEEKHSPQYATETHDNSRSLCTLDIKINVTFLFNKRYSLAWTNISPNSRSGQLSNHQESGKRARKEMHWF